jgi:hypothetical protein
VVPSSSSTLLCTQPTSTTLFPVLSKLTGSVLSFEDLTDNSNMSGQMLCLASASKLPWPADKAQNAQPSKL